MSVRVECDMNELIYACLAPGKPCSTHLINVSHHVQSFSGSYLPLSASGNAPAGISSQRFPTWKGSLRTQNKNLNVQALLTLHEEERFS
jgi:hypothetical protein